MVEGWKVCGGKGYLKWEDHQPLVPSRVKAMRGKGGRKLNIATVWGNMRGIGER